MSTPTPKRPLDVEALKRLDVQELHADDFDEGWRPPLVEALIRITRDWPAIVAALTALTELEGLTSAAASAELEGLRQRVAALEIALRDTDALMWEWSHDTEPDADPEWRPLSVREQRRVNALLLGPADGAAREAEEVSRG